MSQERREGAPDGITERLACETLDELIGRFGWLSDWVGGNNLRELGLKLRPGQSVESKKVAQRTPTMG